MNVGDLGKFWCLHDMVYVNWMWLVCCCVQFNLSCKTLGQFSGGFNPFTSESFSLGVLNFVYDHVRLNCMFLMLHVGSLGLSSLHGPMDKLPKFFYLGSVTSQKFDKHSNPCSQNMARLEKKKGVKLNSISPKK